MLFTNCGYEHWMDLIGTALVISCSEYHWIIPRKSCIIALISRIPLSDTQIDYLRAKRNHLGVFCIDIQ